MAISSALGVGSLAPGVCTSTTRPANPFEGQMIYETDTDIMAIWNGSSWRYIAATTPTNGTVLQTVNATYSTGVSSASSTIVDTGLSATITPKSTSSKILVIVSQSFYAFSPPVSASVYIYRGSTQLTNHIDFGYVSSGPNVLQQYSINYLDSPSTTSATTYKTAFNRVTGTGTVYFQVNSNIGIMTLMEIAG